VDTSSVLGMSKVGVLWNFERGLIAIMVDKKGVCTYCGTKGIDAHCIDAGVHGLRCADYGTLIGHS